MQCYKQEQFLITKPVRIIDNCEEKSVHIISNETGDIIAYVQDDVMDSDGITFCTIHVKDQDYLYMQEISWMKNRNVWSSHGQSNSLEIQNYNLMGKSWWYDQVFTQWHTSSMTIITVGDSITAGYHCENQGGNNQCENCTGDCEIISDATFYFNGQERTITSPNCSLSFQDYWLQKYWPNATIYNYGAAGTTAMSPSDSTASLCSLYNCNNYTLFAGPYTGYPCWDELLEGSLKPDIITFMLGTNDAIYGNQECWGGETQAVVQTYAAIKNMVTKLCTTYPNAVVWLWRPIPNFNTDVECAYPNATTINETYASMKSEIYDVLLQQGLTNLKWLDLWTALTSYGITMENADKYYCDKTHPFDNLNEIIADITYNAMKPNGNGTIIYSCAPPVNDYTPL